MGGGRRVGGCGYRVLYIAVFYLFICLLVKLDRLQQMNGCLQQTGHVLSLGKVLN